MDLPSVSQRNCTMRPVYLNFAVKHDIEGVVDP